MYDTHGIKIIFGRGASPLCRNQVIDITKKSESIWDELDRTARKNIIRAITNCGTIVRGKGLSLGLWGAKNKIFAHYALPKDLQSKTGKRWRATYDTSVDRIANMTGGTFFADHDDLMQAVRDSDYKKLKRYHLPDEKTLDNIKLFFTSKGSAPRLKSTFMTVGVPGFNGRSYDPFSSDNKNWYWSCDSRESEATCVDFTDAPLGSAFHRAEFPHFFNKHTLEMNVRPVKAEIICEL